MSSTQNLAGTAAIEKIKEIAEDANIGMFCTRLTEKPFASVPLATQEVDGEGNIWFLSVKDSEHNHDVENAPDTQLIYASVNKSEYMSLYGKSKILNDRAKIKKLWSATAKIWFQDGPDDPSITLICFTPEEGYYWDTKNGSTIALLKMAASLVTGKTNDDGISGKLSLRKASNALQAVPPIFF